MSSRQLYIPLIVAACAAGCQRYQAKPLDFDLHRDMWAQRSPGAPEVAEFARQLAEAGRMPSVFDVGDGVELAEAEAIALVFNPTLRQARAEADVAAASAKYAGLWQDPVLSVNVLRIISSVPDPWIVGTSVGFTVPLSGRLEVERERASAEEFAALARVAQREWELVNELRIAWFDWSAAQLQVDVAMELMAQLEGIVDVVGRLEEAGERSRVEGRLFRIEAAARHAELQRLEARAAELEQTLNEFMGLRPGLDLAMAPQLSLSVPPMSDADETLLLTANPSLTVARAEYTVTEHALDREIRKQYPDLVIGPAYESDEGQSRVGLGASLPIPIFNRNRRGIAEAEAERESSRVAAEAIYEALVHQLARAYERLERERTLREYIETTLVPLVDEQVSDSRRMLELGELNTLVQLESLVRQTEAKLELIEARRAEAAAAAIVRALLGPERFEPVISGGIQE
jgi:cobalt-zinc-cadmium efflux system outer membrane protein